MENILENILTEGIRNGILKDNRLAAVLLHTVKTGLFFSTSRRDLAALLVAREMPENVIKEIDQNSSKKKDFSDLRCMGVSLKGIKKFPPRSDNNGYGLSFSRNGKPVNSIFVGANGIGKTSIYSALEYAGMRKINSAAARGYTRKIGQASDRNMIPKEDQLAYLRHLDTNLKDIGIKLFTKDREINLQGEDIRKLSGTPEVTEVFYCSDYDVRELEATDDHTRFMLRQIGFNHLYHALQLIYYLGIFVKSKRKRDFSEMWTGNTEYTKTIQRLLLGIATGHVKFQLDFNEKTHNLDNTLDILKSVINNYEDYHLVKNSVESSISLIKEEQVNFPTTDWFTKDIYAQYEELLIVLRDFQRKEFPVDYPMKDNIINSIKKLTAFRKSLIAKIKTLNTNLNEVNDNPESKFELIEEIANHQYELYDPITTVNNASDNESLFPNKEYEKRFPTEYKVLVKYLEDFLRDSLNKWKIKIATPVEEILSDYFAIDNDQISLSLEFTPSADTLNVIEEVSEYMEYPDIHDFVRLNVKVITSREDIATNKKKEVSPRKYLNTFRFKLFCVALKIVLGCFVKERYSINFPYVIDDVFDSSDFDSRLRLKRFIEEIVKRHDSLIDPKKYPIQIIFFSQDDLIADQIYKGLLACMESNNLKFGRIYDYRESEKKDIMELKLGYAVAEPKTEDSATSNEKDDQKKIKYVSIEDGIRE